jgi:hypothetical protein
VDQRGKECDPAWKLAVFFSTLVLADEVERWSLTTLHEKVVKVGATVIARRSGPRRTKNAWAFGGYKFRRTLI